MPAAPAGAQSQPLILVAHSEPATLAGELARRGFRVEQATDGETTLALYDELAPDLLILQLALPKLDGLCCCAELRRRHGEEIVPVVVAAGRDDRRAIAEAYRLGAADLIADPVDWDLVAVRLKSLLQRYANVRGLRRSHTELVSAQRIGGIGSWAWIDGKGPTQWSEQALRLFGWEPGAVTMGEDAYWERVHALDRDRVRQEVLDAGRESKGFRIEHRVVLPNGAVRWMRLAAEEVAAPGAVGRCATIQDITDERLAEERILYLANYDVLTGLANRRLFGERLKRAIQASKARGHQVGLLYLDLDQFKRINDTLGHAAGDTLLRHVSELLLAHVRGSDMVARAEKIENDGAVSRLGGDEFTILLSKIESPEEAADVARRIVAAIPEPLEIEGQTVSVRTSVGIAIFPGDGDTGDELVVNADKAMYHAKELGRNNFQFYSESMNKASLRRISLESRLRLAIKRNELALHYQPRVELQSRRIVGFEALLRWKDFELGRVAPNEIIPLAEETGLIRDIGAWALAEACSQICSWQKAGLPVKPVAVNVSPRQFANRELIQHVTRALLDTGLDPKLLELEITEGILLQDDDDTAAVLRDLRNMGIRIALDDFGTGYSSLSYLTRFPLDVLKLDRVFIRDVDGNPSAAGVVTAVIAMAHSLNAIVVAEGIDIDEQATFLQEHGCDEAQGFLFGPAVEPNEVVRLLHHGVLRGFKRANTEGRS